MQFQAYQRQTMNWRERERERGVRQTEKQFSEIKELNRMQIKGIEEFLFEKERGEEWEGEIGRQKERRMGY